MFKQKRLITYLRKIQAYKIIGIMENKFIQMTMEREKEETLNISICGPQPFLRSKTNLYCEQKRLFLPCSLVAPSCVSLTLKLTNTKCVIITTG